MWTSIKEESSLGQRFDIYDRSLFDMDLNLPVLVRFRGHFGSARFQTT